MTTPIDDHRHRGPHHRLGRGRRGHRRHARARRARGHGPRRRPVGRSRRDSSRSRSQEMVAKYRHGGSCAALGRPAIAYAEGRCVGGSTEINSGLYHRLPPELAEEWQREYRIDEFGTDALDRYAERIEDELGVSRLPGRAARVVGGARAGRDEARLAVGRVLARVPLRAERPRGEADDGAHDAARARSKPAHASSPTAASRGSCATATASSARSASRRRPDGTIERLTARARRPRVRLRGRDADARAAAAQRHPPQHRPRPEDAPDREDRGALRRTRSITATCRCTASPSSRPASRSAARRAAAATSRSRSPTPTPTTPTRSPTGSTSPCTTPRSAAKARAAWSRCPASASPLVTYNLTEGDMSRLARALVHLGEVLLAAGATELYPSVTGGVVARGPDDLVQWWDATHAQPRQPDDRAPHVDGAHRREPGRAPAPTASAGSGATTTCA